MKFEDQTIIDLKKEKFIIVQDSYAPNITWIYRFPNFDTYSANCLMFSEVESGELATNLDQYDLLFEEIESYLPLYRVAIKKYKKLANLK